MTWGRYRAAAAAAITGTIPSAKARPTLPTPARSGLKGAILAQSSVDLFCQPTILKANLLHSPLNRNHAMATTTWPAHLARHTLLLDLQVDCRLHAAHLPLQSQSRISRMG